MLYRVDDDPVLLLCGTVPAYRDLHHRRQGQRRPSAQPATCTSPTADDFTWQTAAALEKLQHDKGFDVTGALEIDDAVFLPESVRIAKVTGELGGFARPGGRVAQATSDTLEVQVALEASQQGEVKQGDRARITLPGNRSVKGTVDRLGNVARTAGKDDDVGTATIPAYISLDEPKKARGLDRAPVQVDITTEGVQSALSVPVTALVGKSGGGFAVEVVRGGGRRELVAVSWACSTPRADASGRGRS